MDLRGKRVLVLGLGKSGMAAAELLLKSEAIVGCSDSGDDDEIKKRATKLEAMGARIELGSHTDSFARDAEMVVISPGIDPNTQIVSAILERGLPLIAEIELAYSFCKCPVLAVTGTNGKTTTARLLERFLVESGRAAVVCGNIGTPFSAVIAESVEPEMVVLEVSSFQLERVKSFKSWIAIALNVSEDHNDRYRGMDAYVIAKAAIFRNQTAGDWAVVRDEDMDIWRGVGAFGNQTVLPFSSDKVLPEGAFVEDGELVLNRGGDRLVLGRTDTVRLMGMHNIENILAAAAAASICGVEPAVMERVLKSFGGLPHRMEPVDEWNGVRFINDSKGTNPDALIRALQAIEGKVVLIAGGRDKGFDYSVLKTEISNRVREIVLIGEARETMKRALSDVARVRFAEDLSNAVRIAMEIAVAGDTVLLSPACSSFDMFKNYEERGNEFKRIVRQLTDRIPVSN